MWYRFNRLSDGWYISFPSLKSCLYHLFFQRNCYMLNCNWSYFKIWMILLYLNRWKNRIIFNRLINSNLWHVVSKNTVLFYIRMAHSLSSSIRCVQSCITDRVWIIQTRLVESSRWLTFYEYLLFPAVNFRSETTQISINFATRLINVSSCPLSLYNFRYFIKCAKLERGKKYIHGRMDKREGLNISRKFFKSKQIRIES